MRAFEAGRNQDLPDPQSGRAPPLLATFQLLLGDLSGIFNHSGFCSAGFPPMLGPQKISANHQPHHQDNGRPDVTHRETNGRARREEGWISRPFIAGTSGASGRRGPLGGGRLRHHFIERGPRSSRHVRMVAAADEKVRVPRSSSITHEGSPAAITLAIAIPPAWVSDRCQLVLALPDVRWWL